MKKLLSTLVAFILFLGISAPVTPSVTAYGSAYENITNEVLQIQSYMNNKMYLEAIQLCEQTKYNRYISYADISLLDQYIQTAKNSYNSYLDNAKKTKTTQYYIPEWCLGYKFFEAYAPVYHYENYMEVYSEPGASISIYSYKIGEVSMVLFYETVKSPRQFASAFAQTVCNNTDLPDERQDTHFEFLSENDTTVGNLPARQVTFRSNENLNRYGTKKDYTIGRCTAFQYGDWVYAIVASKNSYSWGEDFWNKMELVRKTISFY